MKRLLLPVFTLLGFTAFAQFDQISVGAGYSQETFYALADGATQSHPNTAWDIAFGVAGQSAAIWVNEAVGSGMSALPETELYYTDLTDFSETITPDELVDRLYNDEVSWDAGAFNHVLDPQDPFDFGWGHYSFMTHTVTGDRIFAIKLRNGSYKKLLIESLASGAFTFRYADLDGSNEVTEVITKSEYTGKTRVYYAFATQEILDLEPTNWDLLFTRYITPLPDGEGGILDYLVMGVLTGPGVEVAVANGIDPTTVQAADYANAYAADSLTSIGYDWKSFNLTTFQWTVPEDRVYFVKTATDSVFKVQFIDFEGSTTGITTIERTFQGVLTAVNNQLVTGIAKVSLYPNPAQTSVNLALDALDGIRGPAEVILYNTMGQPIYRQAIQLAAGFSVQTLPLNVPAGQYYLQLNTTQGSLTRPLTVQP